MSRALNNIRSWHNPLCLSGIGGLAGVRGLAFICTGTGWFPLEGYNGAPSLPRGGVILIGLVWLFAGGFLWASMAVRRFFIAASALMTGVYATWGVVHGVDLIASPDWDSVVGMALYALMVPVMMTLAHIEVHPPAEPSMGGGDQ